MKKKPVKKPPVKTPRGGFVVPSPVITEKTRKKVTPADLVEVADTNLLIAIDLKRQADKDVYAMEIDADQRLFPYSVLPRLLIGWVTVGFISSFELKLNSDHPLPQIVIRFAEKMTAQEVLQMDPGVKAQIEGSIALIRQFPFIKIESPLLPPTGG